jgi:D-alanine transaminase
MTRVVYVNGRYIPHRDAAVHVEDRGHQFSDAAYEMMLVIGGQLLDFAPHMARLHRSLGELAIAPPMSDAAVRVIIGELLRRNRLTDASVYIQVSRGVAPRDHGFPAAGTPPGLVMVARRMDYAAIARRQQRGVAVITRPESRWARPDIKSVSLLANVLAKQDARDAGTYEALFVDPDGMITEGTASNIWMVSADGALVTRALDASILAGITRAAVLSVAAARQMAIEQRPFSVAELEGAAEAFLTSTTNFVMPITEVDGVKIGDGKPGPVSAAVIDAHQEYVEGDTGTKSPVAS